MDSPAARPVVLLLGSAHLGNRNRDVFNTQFDDMLAPGRQAELRDCAERLARFRPTKVAVEAPTERDADLNREYARYLAGNATPSADEVYQLGFRIAAALGHERVYAVDWNEAVDSDRDLGEVFTYAETHHPELYDRLVVRGQREQDEAQRAVATTSVLEVLRTVNDPDELRRSHEAYMAIARIGEGREYVGIDWVKGWYARNLRIYVNLTRIVTSPQDRALVIYGAGHIPLLAQFIRDGGLHELEDTVTYLR